MAIKDKIILIIDDDPDIIKLLSKIFEVLGVVVLSAQNLIEAKKILYNSIPHLIFLDIKLGDENGLEYLRYLNTLPFGKTLPTIVFTGVNDKKVFKEARSLGAIDIIEKPIVASLLIQKARKYLKESNLNNMIFSDYLNAPQIFRIKGEVVKINQNFMEVETNVKIASNTYLKLQSPLCDKINFTDAKFTSGNYVRVLDLGRYINKLYYLGANNTVIQNINVSRLK